MPEDLKKDVDMSLLAGRVTITEKALVAALRTSLPDEADAMQTAKDCINRQIQFFPKAGINTEDLDENLWRFCVLVTSGQRLKPKSKFGI